jgi:hypothetical protein
MLQGGGLMHPVVHCFVSICEGLGFGVHRQGMGCSLMLPVGVQLVKVRVMMTVPHCC